MGRVAVELWGTPDRYAPGSKLCRYERPSRRQAHSVRRALSYLRADARAWNCVRRPIPGLGAGRFLSCRRGMIPPRWPGRFVGLSCLLLGALCGALRCSSLRCGAFEMPLWRLTLWCLCGALRCDSLRCSSLRCSSSEMSHVIPSRVFQTLKSHRWNCNVFSISKKSEGTQITCDFYSGGIRRRFGRQRQVVPAAMVKSSDGAAAWAPCRLELSSAWGPVRCLCSALRCGAFEMPLWRLTLWCLCGALRCDSLRCGSSEMSHVIPSRIFQTLKSHRWNSAVFSIPMKSEGTQITCDF